MYSCEPSHVHEWLSRAEGAGPAPRSCLSFFWSSPCRPRKKLAMSMGQARETARRWPPSAPPLVLEHQKAWQQKSRGVIMRGRAADQHAARAELGRWRVET
eukprot:scaffold35161_cov64-Phaeocystis_antarctica.AAC.14